MARTTSTSRTELLSFLNLLGAEIPPHTRLLDDVLEKRLAKALDAIQRSPRLIPNPPLDISTLQKWSSDAPLEQCMRRLSFGDAVRARAGVQCAQDPLGDLRSLLDALAETWGQGITSLSVQDAEQQFGIGLRIIDVYMLEDGTPVLPMYYFCTNRQNVTPTSPFVRWAQRQFGKMLMCNATLDTQQLLLGILERNAKRLSRAYKPAQQLFESDFKLSFLLPVGPLSRADVASLSQNNGCEVCGKAAGMRCKQCAFATYCSPECQGVDWPTHKSSCKTLKGATWLTFTMTPMPELGQALGHDGPTYGTLFNRSDVVSEVAEARMAEAVQLSATIPNTHDNKPFLIKVQRDVGVGRDVACLVYDRLHSFEVFILDKGNETVYSTLLGLVHGGGPSRRKVYCWARRLTDRDLEVIVDRLPDQSQAW